MLTKHYFDKKGNSAGRASIGSLPIPDGGSVIENTIQEYPWPIKLEEGLIVQDDDKRPFEGKWYPSAEVEAMKAKREKSNNGKDTEAAK